MDSTHLQTGDREIGYEPNDLWIVFYFDQLSQLVVALQPCQQAAELMVVVGIWQTLKWKQYHRKEKKGEREVRMRFSSSKVTVAT